MSDNSQHSAERPERAMRMKGQSKHTDMAVTWGWTTANTKFNTKQTFFFFFLHHET